MTANRPTSSDSEHDRLALQAEAVLRAVRADFGVASLGNAAALRALADEVVVLREEIEGLKAALRDAEAQADHDALTPLFNRRAFERELRREIALAQRHRHPLCVLYLDLDGFKLVNDRFGHQTGDDVLLHVAGLLRTHTRETDIVARLGGDEFAIVLSQAGLDDARSKAHSLVRRIEAVKVLDPDNTALEPVRMGASVGAAAWQPGMTTAELIRRADEAMYLDKMRRRPPQMTAPAS